MKNKQLKLSDFELEVLQLFWQLEQASAPEIHKKIQSNRNVTYSTVRTIIDRLEQKGAIERFDQSGRAIIFRPAVAQSEVSKPLLRAFIKRVFGEDTRPLISHLFEYESLDDNDIKYLESLIAAKKRATKKSKT